jgi:hypothetical protein
MLASDIFRPEQWNEFFVMVGGAAAALTGLVFVAMSLNLYVIFHDATHRSRAVGTLTAFLGVFMVCALGLMGGQSHVAVGIEWLLVSAAAGYVYVHGYIVARRAGRSRVGLQTLRLAGGTTCYLTQAVGAAFLVFGFIAGLYVAAVAMIVFFAFMISGAWLLLLGVHLGDAEHKSGAVPGGAGRIESGRA